MADSAENTGSAGSNEKTGTVTNSTLKVRAYGAIDSAKVELQNLGSSIWAHPELAWKEVTAHNLLATFLEGKGFTVDRSYTKLQTAFRARFGSGRPNVCVICEYDALPEIGHACGHNLIAEAGVAAGLGVKAAMEKGNISGTVTVLGTPAEEGGGGKVRLIENGAFTDIDAAIMAHPGPGTQVRPLFTARKSYLVKFKGKAAHAAAFPWKGINALDAAVLTCNSISVLRQQMKPTWRVHYIISKGGIKPNIIPEDSEMEIYCRAPVDEELTLLASKVLDCVKAAAQATGCTVNFTEDKPTYKDIRQNATLASSYKSSLESLNIKFEDIVELSASTDMGNVSYVVPSLHTGFSIGTGQVNHTRAFQTVTNTPDSHHKTLLAAKALAHTAIDVLVKDGFLNKVKEDFKSTN